LPFPVGGKNPPLPNPLWCLQW